MSLETGHSRVCSTTGQLSYLQVQESKQWEIDAGKWYVPVKVSWVKIRHNSLKYSGLIFMDN